MALLKHLLTKAVEKGKIEHNPAKGVKLSKENNKRTRFLSIAEYNALLEACPSATLQHIVVLALNTGMRKSELLRLQWQHVNLRQGFLEILEQKNGNYDTVPLNKTALELLRSIPRRVDSEYVFPGTIPGQPFADLKRQFAKAIRKAKLQGVCFHTLRHSAASHLAMNGIDLQTIGEILRHKDYSTTLRYAHLSPTHKKAAVDKLGDVLNAEPEKAEKEKTA